MESFRLLAVAVAALMWSSIARATDVAVNGPGVYNSDTAGAVNYARGVEATGATWARVGFRLDKWKSQDDPTPLGAQGLTYWQAYDAIVDELTTHGVQLYGLISGEEVPGGGDPDTDDWVNRYSTAAMKIIDHFKNRIRVYELFNEPNNWRSGTQQPAISPYYLAKAMQTIYLAEKHDGGRNNDACSQVSLVSGAIFSFEGTNGADYLTQVYQAGRSQLAWDWMRANVGSYPLDGIGYHIYVGQGGNPTTSDIAGRINTNLSGMWNAIAALEPDGAKTPKQIWLSEIGWTIDQVSAQQQASDLTTTFDTLNSFGKVALGIWFTFQDFPGGRYGLIDGGGVKRPDYAAFQGAVAKHPPARHAMFVGDTVPAEIAPGATVPVTLTVKNLGAQVLSESAKVHLAAAPGCPSAAVTNALAWVPPPSGGYATSVTDARLLVPGGATINLGQTVTYAFSITAPAKPGTYTLGARLVQENVAWFGDTFRRTIIVATPSATDGATSSPDGGDALDAGVGGGDGGAGGGDGGAGGGGSGGGGSGIAPGHGCDFAAASTSGCGWGLTATFVAALGLRRRRRRAR